MPVYMFWSQLEQFGTVYILSNKPRGFVDFPQNAFKLIKLIGLECSGLV